MHRLTRRLKLHRRPQSLRPAPTALFPVVLLALASVLLLATLTPLVSNLTDDGPTLPDRGDQSIAGASANRDPGIVIEGASDHGSSSIVIEGASPAVCVATVSTPDYFEYRGCDESGRFVPIDAAESSDGRRTEPPWDVCLVLTVDRIDYQQGRLTGQVALHFPQEFIRSLTDRKTKLLEYSATAGNYVLTNAADAQATFLYMRVLGLDGRESLLKNLSFGAIPKVNAGAPVGILQERATSPCSVNDSYRIDIEIELPVAAHPQAYPYDRYSLAATFELVLPPGVSLCDESQRDESQCDESQRDESQRARYYFGTLVPYTLHIGTGAELSNMTLEVSSGTPILVTYPNLNADERVGDTFGVLSLNLVMTRDHETRLFVLAALAVPFALYLALLSLVLSRRSDDLGLGLLGVVAGFLSVLPLRQVLVPDEVPGLTRVDFILGFQLTLMIATFLALRAFSWRRDTLAAATPEADSGNHAPIQEPAPNEKRALPPEPAGDHPVAPPPSVSP